MHQASSTVGTERVCVCKSPTTFLATFWNESWLVNYTAQCTVHTYVLIYYTNYINDVESTIIFFKNKCLDWSKNKINSRLLYLYAPFFFFLNSPWQYFFPLLLHILLYVKEQIVPMYLLVRGGGTRQTLTHSHS